MLEKLITLNDECIVGAVWCVRCYANKCGTKTCAVFIYNGHSICEQCVGELKEYYGTTPTHNWKLSLNDEGK